MVVGVDGIGGLVEEGRDDARGTLREGVGLVVEDAVNDAAICDTLWVGLDRVVQCDLVQLCAEYLSNCLVNWGLILLMVLQEGIASHLAKRGSLARSG